MKQPIDLTIRVKYPKRYPGKKVQVLKFHFDDKLQLDLEPLKEMISEEINTKFKEETEWKVYALTYLEDYDDKEVKSKTDDEDGKFKSRKYISTDFDILAIPTLTATLEAYVEEKGKPLYGGKRNKKSKRQRNSKKNRKSRRRRV
jgi:hypothetical protein